MSILTITDNAVSRKLPIEEPNIKFEFYQKSSTVTPETNQTNISTALSVLFAYIPTEIIALYIAIISAIDSTSTMGSWIAFGAFLVFTPVVVWLVFAAKYKNSTGVMPTTWSSLPLWEIIAATISFTVWAFALPNSVFNYFEWYSQSIAGVCILLASTALGLISPFFTNKT